MVVNQRYEILKFAADKKDPLIEEIVIGSKRSNNSEMGKILVG